MEVTQDWRKLRREELLRLYPQNIISVLKSKTVTRSGHVTRIVELGNKYKISNIRTEAISTPDAKVTSVFFPAYVISEILQRITEVKDGLQKYLTTEFGSVQPLRAQISDQTL